MATLTLGGLLLSGCGSSAVSAPPAASPSPSGQRIAAPQRELHVPVTCPQQSSITIEWTVENNLTVPIAMHVPPGSLVCDEWSGRSNPTIYNDLVIWPGQPQILRMEVQNPAFSMSRANWSEQFTLPDGSVVADLRFTYGDDGTCMDPCYDTQMWNGMSFESPAVVPLNGPTPETVGSATMSRAGNTYGRLTFHS